MLLPGVPPIQAVVPAIPLEKAVPIRFLPQVVVAVVQVALMVVVRLVQVLPVVVAAVHVGQQAVQVGSESH